MLLTQPQPRHQSCGTRCLPLPRLHGRIAGLLCHSQNTMPASWNIKWGNSSHAFPFSWTVGSEEEKKKKRQKRKRQKKKERFGIQPDISFIFLLIAWSHFTLCWGPLSPTCLPSLCPPCSPPQPQWLWGNAGSKESSTWAPPSLGCALLGCRTGKNSPCSPQQHCQPWSVPQHHSLTLGILRLVRKSEPAATCVG